MFCASCGAKNSDAAEFCAACGAKISLASDPQPEASSPVEAFIPYKNSWALISYYLGVFSLAFCFLGIPALILGIMGLKHAKLHPEARGKVHAWIGIVLGALTTLLMLGVVGLIITASMRRGSPSY